MLLPDLQSNFKILWAEAQINLSALNTFTLGCFIDLLTTKLVLCFRKTWETIAGGDFNLPGMDWDNGTNPKAASKSQCEPLLSSLDTHALAHFLIKELILDLLITNKPGLIKSSHYVPKISDHCNVVIELDIDPPYKTAPSASVQKS